MKKLLFLIFLSLIFLIIGIFYSSKKITISERKSSEIKSKGLATNHPPNRRVKAKVKERKAIFVPEWMIGDKTILTGDYNRFIYFGSEKNLEKFTSQAESWFTLKMTELPEEKNWQSFIQKNINIAKDYNFQGVVLDLEITGLPTDNLVNQINDFVKYFSTEIKKDYIKLAVVVYGDIFYRKRPYDIKFLGETTDEIMVMAYDFHKSRGEPGPNFPFEKGDKYDYDFKTMINDFLRFVPAEKLTIIFGMYGYDWTVDEKRRPITQAKALTLNEIRKKFLTKCEWKDCVVKRDDLSKETEIDYVVPEIKDNFAYLYYHIVWFEDEESVKIKTEFLREKGIGSIAYWAWGYF